MISLTQLKKRLARNIGNIAKNLKLMRRWNLINSFSQGKPIKLALQKRKNRYHFDQYNNDKDIIKCLNLMKMSLQLKE